MRIKFKTSVVDGRNDYVVGEIADFPNDQAKKFIDAGLASKVLSEGEATIENGELKKTNEILQKENQALREENEGLVSEVESLKAPPSLADGDLKAALAMLDSKNDDHWTKDGLPKMLAVEEFLGDGSVTRADIERVAPELTRTSAE